MGRHDWERYDDGESKLDIIGNTVSATVLKHWQNYATMEENIKEILITIRTHEVGAGELPFVKYNRNGVDKVYNRVCLRCGKIDDRIESYKNRIGHKVNLIALSMRVFEERQRRARKLVDGS